VSGEDLTSRALDQAWLFGANFTLAAAEGLTVRDGRRVALEALIGAGVFYGAAAAEARAMAGGDVTGARASAAWRR
jgi:hypothetical protein